MKKHMKTMRTSVGHALVVGILAFGSATTAQSAKVIAVNFDADSQRKIDAGTDSGIPDFPLDGACWNNTTAKDGAGVSVKAFDTSDNSEIEGTSVTLEYSCANLWRWGDAGVVTAFLRGYLDDGGDQANVTISNIPFASYDVIVFAATDTATTSFRPVTVNGQQYYSNASGTGVRGTENWGSSRNTSPAWGTNVFRVNNQTSSMMTLTGGNKDGDVRGCIAAVIVVEHVATIINQPCGSAYTMTQAEAIEADIVTLSFDADATLTLDAQPTRDYTLSCPGSLTLVVSGDIDVPAALASLILQVADGAKITFDSASVPAGLVPPVAGMTYRYEGTGVLPYVPFYGVAHEGVVEVACPVDEIADDGLFTGNKTRVVFDEGFEIRNAPANSRLAIGNAGNVTQHYVQKGGALVFDRAGTTDEDSNPQSHTPLLFAHWPSTVTYDLVSGSISATNGVLAFGWDGTLAMTVGGDTQNPALLAVYGINGANRNNNASLTVGVNGTVKVKDAFGVKLNTNKRILLAGGSLVFDASCAVVGGALEATSLSTVDVGTNTVDASGTSVSGTIAKLGTGELRLGTSRPTLDIREGRVCLEPTVLETAQSRLVLSVPENAAEGSEGRIVLVDSLDNDVTVTSRTLDQVEHRITLEFSTLPSISATGSISDLALANDASGEVVINGANAPEDAFEVLFDEDIPENVWVVVSGHVVLKAADGRTVPMSKILLDEGSRVVLASDIDGAYELAQGSTLAVTNTTITQQLTVTGTLETEGDVALTSRQNFINGHLNVRSGTLTLSSRTMGLHQYVVIESGATLKFTANDQIDYQGLVEINIFGTLDFQNTRQTTGSNNWLNPGNGGLLTGVGGHYSGADGSYYAAADVINSMTFGRKVEEGVENSSVFDMPIGTRNSNVKVTFDARDFNLTIAQLLGGYGTYLIDQPKGFTLGSDSVCEVRANGTTNLTVNAGTVTVNANSGQRSVSGLLKVADGAQVSLQRGDVLDYGNFLTIDIAGTLDMTVRQSISSKHTVVLHRGCQLTGSAGDDLGDFEFYNHNTVTIGDGTGPVAFEAELGLRNSTVATFVSEDPAIVLLSRQIKGMGRTDASNVLFLMAHGAYTEGHHSIVNGASGGYVELAEGVSYNIDSEGRVVFDLDGVTDQVVELGSVRGQAGDFGLFLALTASGNSAYSIRVVNGMLCASKLGFMLLVR